MNTEDLTRRLRAIFAHELTEQVGELDAALLALEQRPRDEEVMRALFRSAHTVKGAARVAGEPLIEQVCHAMEAVFAEVRDHGRVLEGAAVSLLLAVVDGLGEAALRLSTGSRSDDEALRALLPGLEALVAGAPPRAEQAWTEAETVAEAATVGEAVTDAARPSAEPERAGGELVRVQAHRLDQLLAAVGELTVATGRITERAARGDRDVRRLDQAAAEVWELTRKLRLRPFADVCAALPRAVRDVASTGGKLVELTLLGQDVEADRLVVDALREPLLHLVRNAVDHGIEPAGERIRLGKPEAGGITVGAELVGGRLVVTVADDGGGVDENAIRAAMRSRGLVEPRTRAEVGQVVARGGFSTRLEATEISGRGVGLDLVRDAMTRVGGTVDVDWRVGAGTTFTLACPPSPASMRAVLVRVGGNTFALPSSSIERVRRAGTADLVRAGGRTILVTPTGAVPVHTLAGLLGPPFESPRMEGAATLVIVQGGSRRAALVVDELLGEDEIVVRPIRSHGRTVSVAVGATVLPSGTVSIVLSPEHLLGMGAAADAPLGDSFAEGRSAPRQRVLVADDSITTRTFEQSVLEAAGYDVVLAVDGLDAWERLGTAMADAVVADVEMPRMDGITLCRRIRASERFARLPIVLITTLDSPADRARGLEAGADAYIVKSAFDQASLLETINQLIGDE